MVNRPCAAEIQMKPGTSVVFASICGRLDGKKDNT